MAKLNKAARGKHRWVGIRVDSSSVNRELLTEQLEGISNGYFRLFDFVKKDGFVLAIIKTPLSNYEDLRMSLDNEDFFQCLTSSGKIKLVRERLGIERPVRRR